MEKFFRIIGWILLLVLTLAMGAVVVVQSPRAQTLITQEVLSALQGKIQADVSIGKVHIRPFDYVLLKDILIVDRTPYSNPDTENDLGPQDTILQAKYIKAQLSLRSFFTDKAFHLREVSLEKGSAAVVTEPGGMINLTRVLSELLSPPAEEKEKGPSPFSNYDIRVSKVRIEDFGFRFVNMVSPKPHREGGMNFSAIDVTDLNLELRSALIHGGKITGRIDRLSAREACGLNLKELSGKVTFDEEGVHVDDLRIHDDYSTVSLSRFGMLFGKGPGAVDPFEEKVTLVGQISRSEVSMKTISFFAPSLSTSTFGGIVWGDVRGTLNNLAVHEINYVGDDGGIGARLHGTLTDLTDDKKIGLDVTLDELSFSTPSLTRFIRMWSPGLKLDFGKFVPWAGLTAKGTVKGPLSDMDISLGIDSGGTVGDIRVDIGLSDVLRTATVPLHIGGTVNAERLDLGRILSVDALGSSSFTADLSTEIAPHGALPSVVVDSLLVRSIKALGYEYRHLRANGSFSDGALRAGITSSDPNLGLILQGEASPSKETGNFYARVGGRLAYADLVELGLYKGASPRLRISDMDIAGELRTHPSKGRGSIQGGGKEDGSSFIQLSGLTLSTGQGDYPLDPIRVSTRTSPSGARLRLESSLADISFQGSGEDPLRFVDDLLCVTIQKHLPSLRGESAGKGAFSGNSYSFKATTLDTEPLFAVLMPGAYISSGTVLDGALGNGGDLHVNLKSKIMALERRNIRGLDLSIDNEGGALSVGVDLDSVSFNPVSAKDISLRVSSEDDNPRIHLTFDNHSEVPSLGDLRIEGQLSRDGRDSLVVGGRILPSDFTLRGKDMALSSDAISFSRGDLRVKDLLMKMDEGQFLRVDGVFSAVNEGEVLSLVASGVGIEMINDFIKLPAPVGGELWAEGRLISHAGEGVGPGLDLALTCNGASMGGIGIGNLVVGAGSGNISSGIDVTLRCEDSLSRRRIDSSLKVDTSQGALDGKVHLDHFDISFVKPILASLMSDVGGRLSGDIALGGPFGRIATTGDGLRLDDAHFTVGINNVPYRLSGPLSISPTGVTIRDIQMFDPDGNSGVLEGGVDWDHLKDISMNLGARFSDMKVLGLGPDDGQVFWGDIYATGGLSVKGPLEDLAVDIDVASSREGEFHLALAQARSNSTVQLLTFKEPPIEDEDEDPYERMLTTITKSTSHGSRVAVKIAADINPDIEAFVDIDKESGNQLRGKGNGLIQVDLTTPDNTFALGGSYTLTSGNVHLNALNLAYRDFEIQDGSSVHFAGDVMQSDLDITASYRTKATIGTLISDSTAMFRRNVFCDLSISGKLSNPDISTEVRIPDLDPLTQAKVDVALSTTEQSQRQFLALLVTGGFIPDEQSGIENDGSLVNSTLSDLMARQLSNILQYMNIPVDMTLGYRSTSSGTDVFDVGASMSFLDNRLTVNGNFGNKYAGTSGGNDIAGDIDAQYRWNSISFKLFSHSADPYTNYLDNSQRNGLGVAYQRQFDSFRELFTSKKKRKEVELEKAMNPDRKKTLKISEPKERQKK